MYLYNLHIANKFKERGYEREKIWNKMKINTLQICIKYIYIINFYFIFFLLDLKVWILYTYLYMLSFFLSLLLNIIRN